MNDLLFIPELRPDQTRTLDVRRVAFSAWKDPKESPFENYNLSRSDAALHALA